jgi:predicted nucleic acid-binding protein
MDTIYLDSCIVIYLIERHPVFAPLVEKRLAALVEADLAVSLLVRLESLVKPMREADTPLLLRYEQFFAASRMLPMPAEIYEAALSLRVKHNLKTPDALHVATAQLHACGSFWTNDDRLAGAVGDFAVNVTDEI